MRTEASWRIGRIKRQILRASPASDAQPISPIAGALPRGFGLWIADISGHPVKMTVACPATQEGESDENRRGKEL